jgi:hypothetical protein
MKLVFILLFLINANLAYATDYSDLIQNRDFQIDSTLNGNLDLKVIKDKNKYRPNSGAKNMDPKKLFQSYKLTSGNNVSNLNSLYFVELQKEKSTGTIARISEFNRHLEVGNSYIPDWYTTNKFADGKLVSRTTCQGTNARPFFGINTDAKTTCVVVTPSFCKNLDQSLKQYAPGGNLKKLKDDVDSCGTHIKQLLDSDTFANSLKKDKTYVETTKQEERVLNDLIRNVVRGQSMDDSASVKVYEGENTSEKKPEFSAVWRYMFHLRDAITDCDVLKSKNPESFDTETIKSLNGESSAK